MTPTDCPHWDNVSAAADGELPEPASGRALDHALRCAYCGPLLNSITARPTDGNAAAPAIDVEQLSARERRWLGARWSRWFLTAAAVIIVAEAIPAYVTGHGHGLDTQAHAHTARHLATWQIGFGVGLLVAALMSRLTHAMLALATTFATLTIAATVIDVVNGHRGPWAESVHLIELVAILLLWHLTPPHLMPWHRPDRRGRAEAVEPHQPLRLVPTDETDERPT
jgi:hypothetical protein